jgi:hypothetical protein
MNKTNYVNLNYFLRIVYPSNYVNKPIYQFKRIMLIKIIFQYSYINII